MYINATQIRKGMILNLEGTLCRVTWMMHRTPGKGDACIQTKLKNIINNKNMERRFKSSDKVEKAALENQQMQYLYKDEDHYIFMSHSDYEQHMLSKEMFNDLDYFLKEGEDYTVVFYQDKAVDLELPKTMDFKVISAPPVIKKATVTASLSPIILENNLTIQAPAFIKEGDMVRINTETQEYLERVK
ncbi:elongation factor P [bacterium]|jgi:elongation factor P|nr:elongation factor P [bacterium]MBT3580953.1 elongation factor P [bacterium]MBT4551959.1 elongation factor P [bacterium]MBT5988529.1 elongation factor P [bacterium]MBT7087422.1 elongation factor P [bacterium]